MNLLPACFPCVTGMDIEECENCMTHNKRELLLDLEKEIFSGLALTQELRERLEEIRGKLSTAARNLETIKRRYRHV